MAIANVGHEHVLNSTGVSTVAVNKPAGVVDGHRLYAVVSWLANTTSISDVPTGWTLVDVGNNGQLMTSLYTKAASSEPSSWTWTLSATGRCWGWVGAYSGVHASSPLADYAVNTGAGAAHISPAVDVPGGGWLVTVAAGRWLEDASPSATTWTIDDGSDAERKDFSTAVASVQNATGAVWDSNRALTSGTHDRALTPSQTLGQIVGWSLALNPDTPVPEGRLYQAETTIQPPPAPLRAHLYQAYAVTNSGGTGTGRIYQAYARTTAAPGVTPSGIQMQRGAGRGPVQMQVYRGGGL